MSFIDLTGKIFGRLRVHSQGPHRNGRITWLAVCQCGAECGVLRDSLTSGRVQSCGCLQKERTAASNIKRMKHGHARGHKPSPEYHSWQSMNQRCYLPSVPSFPHYGGRGITVCDEWRGSGGFERFLAHIGARPKGTSIDRIDGSKNYEPGNVRWATAKQQSNNRSFSPEGETIRRATLDAGRAKMWSDPVLREKLRVDRASRPRDAKGRILPTS